jgi:hypothetical protein
MIWDSFRSAFGRGNNRPIGSDPEQGTGTNTTNQQAPIPLQSQPSFQPPPGPPPPQRRAEGIDTAPPPDYFADSPLNRPPPVYQKTAPLPAFRLNEGVPPPRFGPVPRNAAELKRKRQVKLSLYALLVAVCGAGVLFGLLRMLGYL